MLELSEIFYSIQGESSFAGFPCIFIRLAGCNLHCHYCDSLQSFQVKETLTCKEIMDRIALYPACNLVEITGGEPLLQEDVYNLMVMLNQNNFQIMLETNGSLDLEKVPSYVHIIVDVKCPGSGYEDCFLLKNLIHLDTCRDEIKFVLTGRKDFDWARNFIGDHKLESYQILFSPVITALSPSELAQWILDEGIKVRLQLQLHKMIWPGHEGWRS
ncbi:MAG: radical SAM protein [Candidatus Cloacimonetes bacterium]|nr:radical SAM protein [Candidatus Cloacimonadota bacterium]